MSTTEAQPSPPPAVAAAPMVPVFAPPEDALPEEPVKDTKPSTTPTVASVDPSIDAEDAKDDDNLTPPPDSPEESASPASSAPAANNDAFDEIVVGTNANGLKASPMNVASDREEADSEDGDATPAVSHYPKRKRNSLYSSLNEERVEDMATPPYDGTPVTGPIKPRTHGQAAVRGIQLGYWRDSAVPDVKDKHGVIGFIDVRDRLRTRIQQTSRSGKLVADKYPLPPGPGGSWVTFERIVFEPHLVMLDHHHIKEYVKIRNEQIGSEQSEDEDESMKQAVVEANRRIRANPPPDTALAPAIAYGPEIPEQVLQNRPEAKKRRLNNGAVARPQQPGSSAQTAQSPSGVAGQFSSAAEAVGASDANGGRAGGPVGPSTPSDPLLEPLPGRRPTKVVVGYWKNSSLPNPADKHAVLGILGANDMFRVKVTRQTRDGRAMNANFPQGAGALWIQYEDVEMEDHLRTLTRPEIKEYCRVRQFQMDQGEAAGDRAANEAKAVQEAQFRAAALRQPGMANSLLAGSPRVPGAGLASRDRAATVATAQNREPMTIGDEEGPGGSPTGRSHDLRAGRRSASDASKDAARPARHSLPAASEVRAANRPPPPSVGGATRDGSNRASFGGIGNTNGLGGLNSNIDRVNSIAHQSVARAEAQQTRIDQRHASRDQAAMASLANKANFSENMSRLNKVWESQESHRMRSGGDDAKIYGGVKYERKQNGPFAGKLVSQGTIISIDGEDYVEYRVLTKPSFF